MHRVRIPAVLFSILFSAGSASAAGVPIDIGEATSLQLLERGRETYLFEARVGEIVAEDVQTPEGCFTRLTIPGFHRALEVGAPALPMMNDLIEIPHGASVRVEIEDRETRVVALDAWGMHHPVLPAQPSRSRDPAAPAPRFAIDTDLYAANREVGRELVTVVPVGQLRSVQLGRLEVAPVRYNPSEQTLAVTTYVRFSLHFEGGSPATQREIKRGTHSPFFEVVYDQVTGARSPHEEYPDLMNGPVTYVVVSDRVFETTLQPFIAWKIEQGFRVIEAYTDQPEVGGTTGSIQAYLHDLYNNASPADPAPTFVLFVGDVEQIPAFDMQGPTDLPYCDATGDYVPDMYYGRFSAQNISQLTPQIEKTLEYEQLLMPDPSYLAESVLIAGMDSWYAEDYGNGQINYAARHYFNTDHGITAYVYLYPESGDHAEEIRQHVSDGVAFANYAAHGDINGWSDPSFQRYHIGQLQNEHEYCLAMGNCCLTSTFDSYECFGEAWLRAPGKGAIGYIGAANYTYWDEDYWWAVGYGPVVPGGADYEETGLGTYDGLFHDHGEPLDQWYVVQDALIFCGDLGVVESGSGMQFYYWRTYNLMGDPSLSPYLGVPAVNPVVHDASIPPEGLRETTLHVEAEPNSYVGVTKAGAIIGQGLIGAAGTADIPIAGQGAGGAAHIVVTCQNKIPYAADVPIGSSSGVSDRLAAGGLRIHPNPAPGRGGLVFDLPQAQKTALQIYDARGRLVRTLLNGSLAAGRHTCRWNGRDGEGRPVGAGLYIVRLKTPAAHEAVKLTLAR
ncbi:MAG: T9SS type A sorting domain-containing protein [Candidatus Eisenbacteria bacterium]|nr:T9SS type A sorting domain-containing protein [Candidatus Eisenbacteria bacterium]